MSNDHEGRFVSQLVTKETWHRQLDGPMARIEFGQIASHKMESWAYFNQLRHTWRGGLAIGFRLCVAERCKGQQQRRG
jgi:hypothetical protein